MDFLTAIISFIIGFVLGRYLEGFKQIANKMREDGEKLRNKNG